MLYCLEILWTGFSSYHSMVYERLQPQSLCIVVNQLDTARRFMWNKVTIAKSIVALSSIETTMKEVSV